MAKKLTIAGPTSIEVGRGATFRAPGFSGVSWRAYASRTGALLKKDSGREFEIIAAALAPDGFEIEASFGTEVETLKVSVAEPNAPRLTLPWWLPCASATLSYTAVTAGLVWGAVALLTSWMAFTSPALANLYKLVSKGDGKATLWLGGQLPTIVVGLVALGLVMAYSLAKEDRQDPTWRTVALAGMAGMALAAARIVLALGYMGALQAAPPSLSPVIICALVALMIWLAVKKLWPQLKEKLGGPPPAA